MKLGAQFFTIRSFCENLNDLSESLKRVKEIGYDYVHISGTCPYEADWLKKELDKNELKCVITHIPPDKILGETLEVVKNHDILDCKYIGLGYHSFDSKEKEVSEHLEEFITKYKPAVKTLKENGKYFMYHNHGFEFIKLDGKPIYRHIMENFSPDELGFTFDTYWVQHAGADPAYWLNEISGRAPCIHLKDHTWDGKMAVIGEGNINFDKIFEVAEKTGVEYMLVEQDNCYDEDPFECLKRSYKNLSALGFK